MTFAGVLLSTTAAFAAVPTWPSGQYFGVLQNVPFTIPVAVSAGAPLTAMSVVTAPANTTGFALQNIDLVHGTADMVGTYTAAANGSTVTAALRATNASGNSSNSSFTLEAYTCSWSTSTGGTYYAFDTKQAAWAVGSQTAYGAAITNGATLGTSVPKPVCADIKVPGLGAATLTYSNPFSGVIAPQNNDNDSSESDMNAGCGIVSILGTNTGSYSGSNCNGGKVLPSPWQNGGTLSLSIGTQSDKGDTNSALTFCPPSQAAVNAGLVDCSVTGSSGSSSYSYNFTNLAVLFNGQPLPQATTFTLSNSNVIAGHALSVTGGTNWWGSSAGAPVAGTGHTQSGAYYSIPAPTVWIGTTRGTAVQATSSTVAVSPTTYACGQASSSVPPNPCTFTPAAPSGAFTVPGSLSPGAYNVYIDEANTTPLTGNGPNDSYQTLTGHSLGTDEAVGTINVVPAPQITSADHASGAEGDPFSFSVTTTGTPTPTITKTSGSLPTGLTLTDNGNGTATIAGTPATGSTGVYHFNLKADNGLGAPATQAFTLTVNLAAAITSSPTATGSESSPFSFTVTSEGVPTPTLSKTGALPSGLTFTDNGDGTATIAGTPAAGTHGSYPLTITATNGVDSPAQQSFTLTIDAGAVITSVDNATAVEGDPFTFTVTATGAPTPALTWSGALPTGISFHDNGDGTATISGTPLANTRGSYPITITANNGVGTPPQQSFTLTVNAAPAITSAASAAAVEGDPFDFTVVSNGAPTPTVSESGDLPSGLSFTDNGDGTATISGTPDAGTNGSYPLTITATNGVGSDAQQSFTLQVNLTASISSAASTSASEGESFSFLVQSSGVPTPAVSETGALPSGVTFTDNGDGTATLAGTPAAGTHGSYPITITADNGVDDPAQQSFTLTVTTTASTGNATMSTNEGNASTHTLNVPITLSSAPGTTVTVSYSTVDGPGAYPADGTSDYAAASGTVTFTAGQTSKNVPITINGDTTVEYDETFSLTITGATGTTVGAQSSTVVTILNDDTAKWSIPTVNVVEGNSGVTAALVTINLTQPAATTTTVNWTTADGKASANPGRRDYIAASGVLTFLPGQTSKQVSVDVRGDTWLEDTEYFRINLSGADDGIPGGVQATGTGLVNILNDELPKLKVPNVGAVVEGGYAVFKPALVQRYYTSYGFCYKTVDGTATATAGDYTPTTGCVTIPAGSKSTIVAVPILFDETAESVETFSLTAYNLVTSVSGKASILANNT